MVSPSVWKTPNTIRIAIGSGRFSSVAPHPDTGRASGLPRTLTTIAALSIVGCWTSARADVDDSVRQYLGRWDLTLHTAQRDYSSWLDIQRNEGQLRIRMVGRWGHARW